jgi:phosphoglycerate dehydrogenase-like enzyme
VVVNAGRGGSLDQEALAAALRGFHPRGAGLDVVDPEPLPPEHPLRDAPNLLITPHLGGRDERQPAQLHALIEEKLRRSRAGETPLHAVPSCERGAR